MRSKNLFAIFFVLPCLTGDIKVPTIWSSLTPVLEARLHQKKLKMKLYEHQILSFTQFLHTLQRPGKHLLQLQTILPKTTVELLRSVSERGVNISEADHMAAYLYDLVLNFEFKNLAAFDENTSHIIGREWHEIDYSDENMTWEKQQKIYEPYNVVNFKSQKYLANFFCRESELPYFKKIYCAKNPYVCKKYNS